MEENSQNSKRTLIYCKAGFDFILRELKKTDAQSMAEHANNFNIWRNVRDLFPNPYTYENALEFIEQTDEFQNDIILGIEIEGSVCGIIGLHSRPDVYKINMELGFWLGETYWNKGIMTTAIREIIKLGFDKPNVKRIYAEVFQHNIGSCRVLEKAGFSREAVFENAIIKDGKVEDVYIYSISRKSIA
jgi:[ribosomal protein S5]-alanine N-acetyltransferase